jgi:hypothetical protein
MDLSPSVEEQKFRDEFRAWLESNAPAYSKRLADNRLLFDSPCF